MRCRLSRTELRRQRKYRSAVVNQSAPPLDHDPIALMAAIDALPRRMRDIINERGIEQDIYDRLPVDAQIRIGNAMCASGDDASNAEAASVWED